MSNGSQDHGSQDTGKAVSADEESLVRELIRQLVGEMASPGSPEVRPGRALREELGFDSVREVEITFVLEELFGFEWLAVEDSPQMETVGDLENFTLDMIAQGHATVPARGEIDRVKNLITRSTRPR
jgi:acyl carrier protein